MGNEKKNKKKLVKCKCEICGRDFMWYKLVYICQEKSTCRVLKHQRNEAQKKLELKTTMLSMEAVAVMNGVLDAAPQTKDFIVAFMKKHEPETVEDMLAVLQSAVGALIELK